MQFIKKTENLLLYAVILIAGVIIGGYLFGGVEPRSFLAINNCENRCLSSKEFLGLLGSVGIQKFGSTLPLIVKETDKTVVINHPFPQAKIHFVIIPKIDIKDIGEIREGDEPYIIDAMAVISNLARENNLTKYRVITNGPGYQSVAYLHFHLLSN